MLITLLDKFALGEDTPLDELTRLGDVNIYDSSTPDEARERCALTDVIVTNKVKITSDIINGAKNLKLICVFATGFDNIDLRAAKERGVAVCNVPAYSTDSVALYTVTTALSLFTKIREYSSFVSSGEYSHSKSANRLTPVYHEIRGKVWGIVGCGNIGTAVLKVAKALGARVIVNKRTPSSAFECVDIDTLCKESDIISVHCPLNEETRGLISAERIRLMKKDVVLVNESRGAVTDEEAIANAVKEGRIGAFGSDVYSVEPFGENHPFYSIKDMNNVLLTPHCAWGAYEARERCIGVICDNIKSFFNGEAKNRVDL